MPSRSLGLPRAAIVAVAATALAAAALATGWAAEYPPVALALDVTPYVTGSFTDRTTEPAFLRHRRDDAGHVSYEVGALKMHPPVRLPVYLIGGSNVRECISTDTEMQAALSTACGVATRVVSLGSTNQHFGETMAIVDNLPAGRGVVVIAVNHTRFAYPPAAAASQVQGTTLLLQSTALWRFVLHTRGSAPRNTIAPGVRAFLADWRRRNAATLHAGRTPHHVYLRHRYFAGHLYSVDRKRSRVALWLENRGRPGGEFDAFQAFNVKLLRALVKRATRRGFAVVLMEAPSDNPVIGSSFDRYRAVYVPACRQVAGDASGVYLDPNGTAGLVNTDFRDLTHLVQPGRAKWTTALAAALAPVVSAAASPSPAPSPSSSAP